MSGPNCCPRGNSELRHFEPNPFDGPVRRGWAININQGGDPAFENIAFCPWCWRRLKENP